MHLLLGRARLRLRPRARWHRSHPGDKTSPDQPPAVRAISRPRQGRDTQIVYHAAQSSSRNEPWTPWPGGRRLCVRNSRPRAAVYRAVSQACEARRRRREGRARHRFGREIRVVHRQGRHLVDRVRVVQRVVQATSAAQCTAGSGSSSAASARAPRQHRAGRPFSTSSRPRGPARVNRQCDPFAITCRACASASRTLEVRRIELLPDHHGARPRSLGRSRDRYLLRAGRWLFGAGRVHVHGKTPGSWAAGAAHRV